MTTTTAQRIAYEWAVRCFGQEHVNNLPIRSVRLVEEAVELAQVLDVPPETLHKLIDVVYSRERGNVPQEIGGVMMTLQILATSYGLSVEQAFENELCRVLSKSTEHFTQRNQEKIDLGLTA